MHNVGVQTSKRLSAQKFGRSSVWAYTSGMPKIIAITGQKGGVGKTTIAIAIADELHRRGQKTLLVDADPQGSARTWGDVAGEQNRDVPTVIAMGANLHRKDQLPTIAEQYGWVVIDTPGRIGTIQRAALMIADMVVLPCGPTAVDAWALTETLDLLEEAKTIRESLRARILITRVVGGTVIARQAHDALSESGQGILQTQLGYRVAYQEAPAAGLGVTKYAKGSRAANEVIQLVDELSDLMKGKRNGK